jgi:hypothetical protein
MQPSVQLHSRVPRGDLIKTSCPFLLTPELLRVQSLSYFLFNYPNNTKWSVHITKLLVA